MKAHYGTTPIPIPQTYTSPQQIGKLSRDVQQSIKALRDRAVVVHGARSPTSSQKMPFKGYGLRLNDTEYKVKVFPGYFLSMHPTEGGEELGTGEFVRYVMPLIGVVPLDDEAVPELVVAAGQTVYLRVETDIRDRPTEIPHIVADVADKQGVINYPPESGVARVYYYALFDITADEPLAIKNQRHIGGPLIHTPSPAGWWGKAVWRFDDLTDSTWVNTEFIIEDGRIISVHQVVDGGSPSDVIGTALDPAIVTHNSVNSDT